MKRARAPGRVRRRWWCSPWCLNRRWSVEPPSSLSIAACEPIQRNGLALSRLDGLRVGEHLSRAHRSYVVRKASYRSAWSAGGSTLGLFSFVVGTNA